MAPHCPQTSERAPWLRDSCGTARVFHASTRGGTTWRLTTTQETNTTYDDGTNRGQTRIETALMLHDPNVVMDGTEVPPNDQIIAVRRSACLVSVAERTGGWQRRFNAEADLVHAESTGRA